MRKMTLALLAMAIVLTACIAIAEDATIIGAAKCKMCHKAKTGDQFKIWAESKHATSFATLKTEESIAIATEMGLGNPWEAPECLKCHVTQAFLGAELHAKTKYVDDEGVGCEACHGAGSEYKSKKVMTDHDASIAAGLVLEGESSCVKCHNENSPTFKGFEYEARWAEIVHPVPAAE